MPNLGVFPSIVTLLRPHQWVKNLFVAAPLFFAPSALSAATVLSVGQGILGFCAASSAAYVFNDIFDRESDRLHPVKSQRPIASGVVSPFLAAAIAALALAIALGLGFHLAPAFGAIVATYLALNLGYSVWLKHTPIIDVMIISFGFVLRVWAGGIAIDIEPSAWIFIIAGLLALFLALAKRRDDIIRNVDRSHRGSLDGYDKHFLDIAISIVLGALLVGYLVYTTDQSVMTRLGTRYLFVTTPFVVAGVLRYLQITLVEERSGAPTHIVLTDRFMIATIVGWALTFAVIIYP